VVLLDGGHEAYPRMLLAIEAAAREVLLEVYIFQVDGWGRRFCDALAAASQRGARVRVTVDGWGSVASADELSARLSSAGCEVRVYHPLVQLLVGRFRRNHRKVLLVDGERAFIGGINIGDDFAQSERAAGWADLAVEVRGVAAARLRERLLGRVRAVASTEAGATDVQLYLSGARGGGYHLRRRYRLAIDGARRELLLAQAYFLPDAALVRALVRAARRGVRVTVLLSAQSDVPLFGLASRSLFARLLASGIELREWTRSVLHAKSCVVDDERFLVGSFNLDPLSLANQEALVEVRRPAVVAQGRAWMERHLDGARRVEAQERSRVERWLIAPVGLVVARLAQLLGLLLRRG
jgi:cardiolipin synthase